MLAEYINELFHGLDYAILNFMHNLALSYGDILTPAAEFFQTIGQLPFLLTGWLALILFIVMKDKKLGLNMLVATVITAVMVSLFIKGYVQRLRPYDYSVVSEYHDWFVLVNSNVQSDVYSFPSGHTSAAMAGVTAFFIWSKNKKLSWLAFIYVILMGASRNYLMVHFPSDVMVGVLVGLISAIIAHYLIEWLFKHLEDKGNPIARYLLGK